MTACEPAEPLAPAGTVSGMASLDALVIVSAERLILGADVAAAKFVKGQEIESLFDRQLRANAYLRTHGELRRNAAGVALRSLYRP